MTRLHPFLHPFGWGSVAGGIVVAVLGTVSNTELGALAWTYGVLVVCAAAFLLIGLRVHGAVRARHEQRSMATRAVSRTQVSRA